ncbi:MAG: apolipoprotein N-acyltransferase [Steroidobacteraceae bacterium]
MTLRLQFQAMLRGCLQGRWAFALAMFAGALTSAAFAPLAWWWLAPLTPALLILLWQDASPRRAALLGFLFNAATFGIGTYWLYISIHGFGQAPIWLAIVLMAGLVGIMGLYHAALGFAVARWLPARGWARWMLGIPALWLLIEWWRGWFLSGFAWLSLGYSQIDTVLAALAPVGGVYLVSLAILVIAGALATLVLGRGHERQSATLVILLLIGAAFALHGRPWTRAAGPAIEVAIVQGAIPQDQKWLDSNLDASLKRYRELNAQVLGTPLIVWPESAAPDLANHIAPWLGSVYREARASGSSIVMGLVRADDRLENYYNSVLAMDEELMWYDKDHLVPFAEFFPVPGFIRNWLRLMSLPYADFTRGGARQPPLQAAGLKLGASICYEDAYGSSQARWFADVTALVNVTNDAWFAHSSARYQHFQIARMRALESGRYLIRAANDGVSAIIGPDGKVRTQAAEYQPTVLRGHIEPRSGLPPYGRVGNWLVVLLAAAMVVAARRLV